MSGTRPEREAVVIGYGFEYLVMAINCGHSIRASNPGLTTTLVTNLPVDVAALGAAFDRVVVRDEPADLNRLVKTSILDHTLAGKVLYVDADSEVVGDLSPFFRLLDRFDVVLRLQAVPVNKSFELAEGIPGGAFPHYHGGAFLLRDDKAARGFLAHWQRRMVESGLSRDQPALARTVYDLPDLRLLVVNSVLCAEDFEHRTLFKSKHEQPRIRHYRFAEHDARIARSLLTIAAGPRTFVPPALLDSDEVCAVQARYRYRARQAHFQRYRRWFRPFLFRLSVISRLSRRQSVARRSFVQGQEYKSGAGRLWDE